MAKDRIGIFGGTFNPIHLGHLKAAEIVQKKFHLEEVLFIPSYIPPHKESVEIVAPFYRLKMVELALDSYPQFVPSSIEIDAKGKSYSIVTLKKIKRLYPQASIFFVLGIDAFLEIDTWREYHSLLEQCYFVVISRPGYRLDDAKKILGGEFRKRMVEISESAEVNEKKVASYKIFFFPIDSLDVASTEIRERIKRGESIKGMVPEAVRNYIQENNLYCMKNG